MVDEIQKRPNNQLPDESEGWKEKYLRLLADLENTKKRLTRTSALEVETQKEPC
jgi:molecular chaperone GrpE